MADLLAEHRLPTGQIIRVLQGDLTEEDVDAIVNAANSQLAHGGGVAGAIVRRGGREIQDESDRIAPVPVGRAKMTGAGRLPARHVIHTVGPVWGEGDEDAKLRSAVRSSLALAEEHRFATISIPAVSSGIFGFPKGRCARVFMSAIGGYFRAHPDGSLQEVRLCNIHAETAQIFAQALRTWAVEGAAGLE
jgi:O-acetyl-ADP-ribose deacetylase (regulator of RNase III)